MKKAAMGIGLAIFIAGIIVLGIFMNKKDDSIPQPVTNERHLVLNDIVVEIKGEVKKPGIYVLQADSRIHDLVLLAGGFTERADTATLNMAAKIIDGSAIFVETKQSGSSVSINNKISINTASMDELMKLPGIGESKAKSIIDYRNTHGRFYSFEDLINVSGISKNILEQIKDLICL